MLKNLHNYVLLRVVLFKTFLNFTYGFLQNVLSKILSINNLYWSLSKAISVGDVEWQFFDIGRLIRTLGDFDPVEMEEPEDDWYYN